MVDQEVEVFDVSDITERAVKTGVEAFVVALPAGLVFSDAAVAIVTAKAAGFSACLAAASVVVNTVHQWSKSKKSKVQF